MREKNIFVKKVKYSTIIRKRDQTVEYFNRKVECDRNHYIKVIWAFKGIFHIQWNNVQKTCINIHHWIFFCVCLCLFFSKSYISQKDDWCCWWLFFVRFFFLWPIYKKVWKYFCTIYEFNWNLSGNWTNLAFPFWDVSA